MKAGLGFIMVWMFCLLLISCGKTENQSVERKPQNVEDGAEAACDRYLKAKKTLRKNLSEYEKGVLYAYFCQ